MKTHTPYPTSDVHPASRLLATLLLLILIFATTARAASVAWTTSTVSAPADVSTAGTLVGAMNVGSSTAQTVNGVTFAADPTGAGPLALGSATVSFGNFATTFNNYWALANPGGDAAYAGALDFGRTGLNSADGTVTLGGLTVGRTYLVQLWIVDTRSGLTTRVRNVDGVPTTSGGPNLATGAFVADAATQVITISHSPGAYGPQVNLLQVRDVHFWVTNNADSGTGSLRQAIANAIAEPGANTVFFGPNLSGQTITLSASSEIVFTGADAITVDGSALAQPVMVDGAGASRLFRLAGGANVTLRNLIITGGNGASTTASGNGGAIYSLGTLTVEDCTFTGNAATVHGGAIHLNTASAALTVTRCTFTGNSASNAANRFGGAIHTLSPATVTLSTFSGNSAWRGGALRGQHATLDIRQCTFTGNTAAVGGGLSFGGTGTVSLSHVTVTANHATGSSGGGIQNDMDGGWTLENSIVSGNTSALSAADIENQDPLTYLGANLVQTVVNTGTGSVSGPAPISTAPLLAALGSYGGTTQTMPPLTGSPAIDAALGSTITTDQRGAAITGTADLGASENTVPTISNIADLVVNEDSLAAARTVSFTIGNVTASPSLSATSTDTALVPSFTFGGSGASRTVLLNVPANANGSATITVTVSDGAATASDSFLLTVTPVNDRPTFTKGADKANLPNSGPQTVPGWATAISKGPTDESGQTLTFSVTSNTNPALFTVQPAIAPDGTLTYTPAGPVGTATISVTLSDDGGTANGGVSTSNAQTFTIFVKNPIVVVNNADTGAGSLRQAVTDAAASPGGDFIHFDPALSAGTITLINSEIVLSDDLTIDARSLPNGLTFNGGTGTNRIFFVSSGRTVSLHGITLTGGNGTGAIASGRGGAIYNNGGTLTLTQCTLSGNSAGSGGTFGADGGAIYNVGTLTLTQCTLSGNSAGNGSAAGGAGGAIHTAGTLTLTQCTLSGNSAGSGGTFAGDGGAIVIGNDGTLTLRNSLIAGNTAPSGPDIYVVNVVSGTLTRSGVNFIGDVTDSGQTANSTLLTGNAQLAALGNYGGPTQTVRLLFNSPALNRIASPLFPTDQRGFPIVGSADIGAYENGAPTITAIAARVILANTNTGAIPFTVGDAESTSFTVTRTSSNTTLVPLANVVLGGSGTARTVTVTPATTLTGNATITLTVSDGANTATTSFLLTVLPNTPYNTWKLAQFGNNAANPALAGDTADADGDGLNTTLEYATNGNPLAYTAAPLTGPVPVAGPAMQFTFPYRSTYELRYYLDRTSDLTAPGGGWVEVYHYDIALGEAPTSGVSATINTTTGIITITDTTTGTKLYWRLRVGPNPDSGA